MAIRTIITHPHPVLRQKAEPVTVFDDELQTLIQDAPRAGPPRAG